MYRGRTIAVVVPAHNEAAHVVNVVDTLPDFVDHVVVVDDGSTDETAAVVTSLASRRTELIHHRQRRGVGAAIVTGHRRALALACELSVVMDADGQMDPAHLGRLLDPLVEGRCEYTKGNRFFAATSARGMPAPRVVGNIVLSLATKVASGYWRVFDSQNGYTAIAAAQLRRMDLDRLHPGYGFNNDLLIELRMSGARVRDVRIPAVYGEEVSGIRPFKDSALILHVLAAGFWRRHTRYRPAGRPPGIVPDKDPGSERGPAHCLAHEGQTLEAVTGRGLAPQRSTELS